MSAVETKLMQNNEIFYYDEVDSTNLKALELAVQGAKEGTVVVAVRQTAGRGRMQRVWESPAGQGLWFSMVLRPTAAAEYGAQITLLAAVAAAKSLRKLSNEKFTIKWPNDIMLDGKKICGILSEMALNEADGIEYIVVGIGINIKMSSEDFGAQLAAAATSLYLATGITYEREQVLKAFLDEFDQLYQSWQRHGFASIRREWLCYNCTLGSQIEVKDNDQVIYFGTAEDMDDYGSLLVRNAAGEIEKFDFGEISIRSC